MPTFVAASLPDRRREAGFTLVELLVVLAVMGLLVGVAVWRWPIGNERARSDALAFATRVAAARDQAILSGRPLAVEVDAAGYRFEARQGGEWVPTSESSLRERRWSEGVRAELSGSRVRIRFDGVGLPDAALRVTLRGPGKAARVDVPADGEVIVS